MKNNKNHGKILIETYASFNRLPWRPPSSPRISLYNLKLSNAILFLSFLKLFYYNLKLFNNFNTPKSYKTFLNIHLL